MTMECLSSTQTFANGTRGELVHQCNGFCFVKSPKFVGRH